MFLILLFFSAVILPTAWIYISTRYDAESYVFGFVIAAFSFAGFFSGPIVGK